MDNIEQGELKKVFKEALKEWMDEKLKLAYEDAGRWLFHTLLVIAVGILTYVVLAANGWKPPTHDAISIPGLH